MIVDTSALVAVVYKERRWQALFSALTKHPGIIPAPVLVELRRVTALKGNTADPDVSELIATLLQRTMSIESFTPEDAGLAVTANEQHGSGNFRGGTLNLLDLMVYGMAKRTGRPILCTGRDFAATGIQIHPASRID